MLSAARYIRWAIDWLLGEDDEPGTAEHPIEAKVPDRLPHAVRLAELNAFGDALLRQAARGGPYRAKRAHRR